MGTGISAPASLLLALVLFAHRLDPRGVRSVAGLLTVGAAGEPATWRALRRPGADRLGTQIVVANVALPLLAIASTAQGGVRA